MRFIVYNPLNCSLWLCILMFISYPISPWSSSWLVFIVIVSAAQTYVGGNSDHCCSAWHCGQTFCGSLRPEVWTTKSPIWVSSWSTCSTASCCVFCVRRLVDRFRIGGLVSGSKQYVFPLNVVLNRQPMFWTYVPTYTSTVLNQNTCTSILKWHFSSFVVTRYSEKVPCQQRFLFESAKKSAWVVDSKTKQLTSLNHKWPRWPHVLRSIQEELWTMESHHAGFHCGFW